MNRFSLLLPAVCAAGVLAIVSVGAPPVFGAEALPASGSGAVLASGTDALPAFGATLPEGGHSEVRRRHEAVVERLFDLGFLAPVDRPSLEVHEVRVAVDSNYTTWSLETLRRGRFEKTNHVHRIGGVLIKKLSGHFLVILNPELNPEQIVPLRGDEIRIFHGGHPISSIDHEGHWGVVESLPALFAGRGDLEIRRASLRGERVVAGRPTFSEIDDWRVSAFDGGKVVFGVGDTLELSDGRRFAGRENGVATPVPAYGEPALWAEEIGRSPLAALVRKCARALSLAPWGSGMPPPEEIKAARVSTAELRGTAPRALHALSGPAREGVSWVLLFDQLTGELVWPHELDEPETVVVSGRRQALPTGSHRWSVRR